jgi:hypothetical protein
VGPLLDLAVVALAVMVCGSLVLLAWTLGVSTPRALRRFRTELFVARLQVTRAERRLRETVEEARRRRPAAAPPRAGDAGDS